MMYPLVLALAFGLVSSARAVQYGAASNKAWRLSGPHMNVPVNGCTSYPDALALFPGASATYSFNGTAISVLGLTYNGGTDAVITVDGANVHSVAADSNAITCKLFASISGLDGTRVHTLSIVVSKKKSRRAPPPPPGQPNGGDIGGGNQGSSLPAAFPIKAVDITPYTQPAAPPPTSPPPPSAPAPTSDPVDDPSTNSPESENTSSRSASPTPQPGTGESDVDNTHTDTTISTGNGASDDNSKPTKTLPPLVVQITDTQVPAPDATGGSPTSASSSNSSDDLSNLGGADSGSSSSAGPSATVLVPAILVPLFVLLMCGYGLYILRRRRSNRIPPSAAFRMENPLGMSEIEQRPAWMQNAVEARGRDRSWSNFSDDARR